MATSQRRSPVPGIGLEGYSDKITITAGEPINLMLSGPPQRAEIDIVRLIHGDPNPAGPGYKAEAVDWGQPTSLAIHRQHTDYGSYVEIPHSQSLNPASAFTLSLWFHPTLMPTGWHVLAAKWAPENLSYGLFYAGDRFVCAAVSRDGRTAQWLTARETAHVNCWSFVAFTFDADTGRASIYQRVGESSSTTETRSSTDAVSMNTKRFPSGPVFDGTAPLYFGAIPDPDSPQRHWAHFNGKIAHPTLLSKALDRTEVAAVSDTRDAQDSEETLGCWDLSLEITGSRIVDVSSHGNHGRAVNMPARAVTGPFWSGMPSRLFTDAPRDYNAIYFHDDDLEDSAWSSACELHSDPESPSGIYAAHVRGNADELFVPFVVTPKHPTADIACIVPTLTWQAYASNRSVFSYTEDGVLDSGLSLYNVHSDGSMIYYRTRLQPTRAWNPKEGFQHWGAHMATANLYLIDWLEHKGFTYDVYADEDLHANGSALLSRYACVITGSHHEYCTANIVDSLWRYSQSGGRILNLGGNALYWVVSLDAERPHIVELRKGGDADYGPTYVPLPGEAQHSTTLELGGLWSRRGRPPHATLGVEFSANVWTDAGGRWGFKRTPQSREPRFEFVFDGIEDGETIGDFGLNLGSAAGFEMDSVQTMGPMDGAAPTVLAEASHSTFSPPRRPPVPPRAHIAIWSRPAGGAVFSAASVTWTGSLSYAGYANNVSRITENVLRRFLETPAGQSVIDDS